MDILEFLRGLEVGMRFQCRYVLGAVFLQLCQLLRLEQHPIMQRPVDPSLFIHRFADRECFFPSE